MSMYVGFLIRFWSNPIVNKTIRFPIKKVKGKQTAIPKKYTEKHLKPRESHIDELIFIISSKVKVMTDFESTTRMG
jgi:hypothetical protein